MLFSMLFGTLPPPALSPAVPFAPPQTIAAPAPTRLDVSYAPVLTAPAALVLDAGSGRILYAKKVFAAWPMASITKLMTVLVAREYYPADHYLTLSADAKVVEGGTLEAPAGETFRVEDLYRALLIKSANDVALNFALAYPGGAPAFMAAMNRKADQMQLLSSHFTNPVGLDDPNLYSTVYDLAVLLRVVAQDPVLKDIMTTNVSTITSLSGRSYELENTNQLFGSYLTVLAGKTGTTPAAGACLAAVVKRSHQPALITVVLGSTDRFKDTKVLAEWAWRNYAWSD